MWWFGRAMRSRLLSLARPQTATQCNFQCVSDLRPTLVPDRRPEQGPAALATAIGRSDLIQDPRFKEDADRAANAPALTETLDAVFISQPLEHRRGALNQAHITYGVVRPHSEAMSDPQLLKNEIIVPREGAGE